MSQIGEAFVCASQALNENIVLKVMGLNENALKYVLLSVAREDDEDCHYTRLTALLKDIVYFKFTKYMFLEDRHR